MTTEITLNAEQKRQVCKSLRQKKEVSFELYIRKCPNKTPGKLSYINLSSRGKGKRRQNFQQTRAKKRVNGASKEEVEDSKDIRGFRIGHVEIMLPREHSSSSYIG